jgi:hypothetical protein
MQALWSGIAAEVAFFAYTSLPDPYLPWWWILVLWISFFLLWRYRRRLWRLLKRIWRGVKPILSFGWHFIRINFKYTLAIPESAWLTWVMTKFLSLWLGNFIGLVPERWRWVLPVVIFVWQILHRWGEGFSWTRWLWLVLTSLIGVVLLKIYLT